MIRQRLKEILIKSGALLAVAGLIALSSINLSPRAYAVDIFSQCTNSSVNQNCNDCKGALNNTGVCGDVSTQNSNKTNPIISDLKVAINLLSIAIGVTSVIIIILSGLRMTISSDAQSLSRARDGVIYSLVGILIAVMSQAIVIFVLDKLS